MPEYIKVTLHSGKDHSLKRFHPWVFSGAIKKISLPPDYEGEDLKEGDVVEVYTSQNELLGMGHYQIGSIAIRMFSFKMVEPDKAFWKSKLQKAYDFRTQLGLTNNPATNCYRLFFGEGDGLPGLVIDFYNGTAVFQSHSIGMHLIKPLLVECLREIYGDKLTAAYDKSEDTMPKQAPVKAPNGYLWKTEGVTGETIALENHNKFYVDWESGQKTGFFLDQRYNRELLASYSKDKVVLNTFCYTGGFSVYAANAGAKEVHSIDISKKAIELTDRNIELNGIKNHQSFAMDTFEFLKHRENTYDIIVLDPPAFAKHQNVKHNAVMGYKRLNYEAIKQIKPGGLLFTFSCSQVVDKNTFNSTVMAAAIEAGRNVRVLHHLSQPPDHCVNIFHPEGEYLKGLVVHIE
ncbi:MAG: SAM-dependent methyltransferase [Bacteroidetes bacterium]|jgi:23S rRNA (cytosine1962-C5)-methyltransferase|nr:SAM-dependent methyltransferase [Bacteroidota bacterium]